MICDRGERHLSRLWNPEYTAKYGITWPAKNVVPAALKPVPAAPGLKPPSPATLSRLDKKWSAAGLNALAAAEGALAASSAAGAAAAGAPIFKETRSSVLRMQHAPPSKLPRPSSKVTWTAH